MMSSESVCSTPFRCVRAEWVYSCAHPRETFSLSVNFCCFNIKLYIYIFLYIFFSVYVLPILRVDLQWMCALPLIEYVVKYGVHARIYAKSTLLNFQPVCVSECSVAASLDAIDRENHISHHPQSMQLRICASPIRALYRIDNIKILCLEHSLRTYRQIYA